MNFEVYQILHDTCLLIDEYIPIKQPQPSLTLIVQGGGGNHHPLLETRDCSGTEHPLDLRPVCKVEFIRCLETNLGKLISLGPDLTLSALFYQGSPEISLAGSSFGSILGSMNVQEGPLSLDRVGQ